VKRLEDVKLTPNECAALDETRHRLFNECPVEELVLFGSVARGEADEESDIDLLAITAEILSWDAQNELTGIVTEVNLEYETNFSTLVVDKQAWESGVYRILPIKQEILKDGVLV
jgi:uncharacterized protein